MDVKSTWIPTCMKWTMFHDHLDYFQEPPLGHRSNTNRETMALRMLTTRWFILFYRVWGPTWIKIHWSSIWLRAQSHMTSHYTWGSMTTLHDFGGVSGRPLDTFFGLSQLHGHGSWLVCEVTLSNLQIKLIYQRQGWRQFKVNVKWATFHPWPKPQTQM